MPNEKKNPTLDDQLTIEPVGTSPPGKAAGDAPTQEQASQPGPGDVVVSADKINELMADRKAAAREAVEKEMAAEAEKDSKAASDEKAPRHGRPAKEKADTPAQTTPEEKPPGGGAEIPVDDRPPWEKTQAELDAEEAAQKPRRGRPPKVEKAAPEAEKPASARKGRSAKAEKSSPDKSDKATRDKVSQSKTGKSAPAAPAAGQGAPAAPSVSEPEATPAGPTEPPQPIVDGKIVYLKLEDLHPFHTFGEHPYNVESSANFEEVAASIKENGVWTPATVRPEKDGNGYEIIAGHCRHKASELAGLEALPCIIREMDDQTAFREMKGSNKQRGDPLPSELARLLAMEAEAVKHQGSKIAGVAAGDVGKRSLEIVGQNNDMNYKKVMRYIRLNSLVPDLLGMVDQKRIGFMPAVELSYIKPKNQRLIAVSIEGEQSSPSVSQAKKLRELDKDGKLTGDVIDGILSEEKKEVDRVIITTDELNKYFGKEMTPRQMKDQIMALLDEWKERQPEKAAPQKSAERG